MLLFPISTKDGTTVWWAFKQISCILTCGETGMDNQYDVASKNDKFQQNLLVLSSKHKKTLHWSWRLKVSHPTRCYTPEGRNFDSYCHGKLISGTWHTNRQIFLKFPCQRSKNVDINNFYRTYGILTINHVLHCEGLHH
jgi:hypothetical protein